MSDEFTNQQLLPGVSPLSDEFTNQQLLPSVSPLSDEFTDQEGLIKRAFFKQMYSKQGLKKLLLTPPGSFRFTRTQTSTDSSFHPQALVIGAL